MDEEVFVALQPPTQFNKLRKYFEGLTVRDMSRFTKEELLESVEQKDRVLLVLFLKNHLGDYLEQMDSYNKEEMMAA